MVDLGLDENQVVDIVCAHLVSNGYFITAKCTTTQQGIDIVATKDGARLLVEAKGATSSRRGSERFEKGLRQARYLIELLRVPTRR
jgi:hypothetical protein